MRSVTCSASWTRSTYSREAAPMTTAPFGPHLEQFLQAATERVLGRVEDRHVDPVRLPGARHCLLVQERDDRLAERHRLDREQPVPARVELIDDDVDVVEERECLGVVQVLDDAKLDVEALAGGDHVIGALALTRRRRMEHDRPGAVGRRHRAGSHRGRCRVGSRVPPEPSGSRRSCPRSRLRPSSRRRSRRAPCRGCPSRGSASPTASRTTAGSGTGATAARG